MKISNNLAIALSLLLIGAVCAACAAKREDVRGKARLTGNAPFYEMSISGEDGCEWHILPAEREKLMDLQQQTVTVRGVKSVEKLQTAGGIEITRLYLKDIEIKADDGKQSSAPPAAACGFK